MLIRRPGQPWHPLQPALHDERALQTLLVQSPSLLPSPGAGELAVAANFRIGSTASVDLLGVGVDGRIVLVECGRQEGPGRRPMGGAALAVGAGLWRAPYEEFDRAFAVRAGVPLLDKAAAIARAGGLGWDEAAFRAGINENLGSGRFQLILAVDVVSDEVRQVVAYLNAGARPGLAAVALGLRYHAEEGVEILIPSVFKGEAGRDELLGDGAGGGGGEVSLPAASEAPAPAPAGVQASLASRPAPAAAPSGPASGPAPAGTASGSAPSGPAPKPSAAPAAPSGGTRARSGGTAAPTVDPAPGGAPAAGSLSPFARPAVQEVEAPATSSDEPTTDAASDPAATSGATPGGPVGPGGAAPAEPTTNVPVAAEGTESTRAESAPEPAATPAA